MADYLTPTVIQPDIPVGDLTPLEHLVLTSVFEAEAGDNGGLYFFTPLGPAESVELAIDDLLGAFEASVQTASRLTDFVAQRLPAQGEDVTHVEIDLSDLPWTLMFQDIVRRSPTLRFVSAVSAYTCSHMLPDGFGGQVILITAHTVACRTTDDLLVGLLADAGM